MGRRGWLLAWIGRLTGLLSGRIGHDCQVPNALSHNTLDIIPLRRTGLCFWSVAGWDDFGKDFQNKTILCRPWAFPASAWHEERQPLMSTTHTMGSPSHRGGNVFFRRMEAGGNAERGTRNAESAWSKGRFRSV
jgi:hypothetical protein